MFGDIIQPTHLIFILVVALLILGPKRLPEVGRSLGKGIRDFRSAMAGMEEPTMGLLEVEPVHKSSLADQDPAATTGPRPFAEAAALSESARRNDG